MAEKTLILGAGMTGLAAGLSSGLPVLEAAAEPGGICSSYYLPPGGSVPLAAPPEDGDAYRFEVGGGHWIFGGDPVVLRFLRRRVSLDRYYRRSSAFFPESALYVPYPIQNNLRYFDRDLAATALEEMVRTVPGGGHHLPAGETMLDWLRTSFGPTLTERFFGPFHELYTAGLHRRIAPQDPYKSPVDLGLALRGAFDDAPAVGYNVSFLYPRAGLDGLARRLAADCRIEFGARVAGFDVPRREVIMEDGRRRRYESVISTVPLNRALTMAGLETGAPTDPHTSVLVLNIGARRGPRCPDDHWLYVPRSLAGFHRVGFYSNVDAGFLPAGRARECVSIYVERAFAGDEPAPAGAELARYQQEVVGELRAWGFIGEAEVVHPTWIDVAYTWSWPGSRWRAEALKALEEAGIYQVGRYGRWIFQGIADSVRDGLTAGASWKG